MRTCHRAQACRLRDARKAAKARDVILISPSSTGVTNMGKP